MHLLERDGVALFYEKVDGAKTPIVLVHGWCCDHRYFAPQFKHFGDAGHTVVTLDLRGHGISDKPEQRYTLPGFADDVAWMCEELRIGKPIIVGHSMGGIIAYDMAVRYPDRIAAAVMLDAAALLPAPARAVIAGSIEALRGPNGVEVLRDYVDRILFIPTDDPERCARILDHMSSAAPHVMVSCGEALRDYDPSGGEAGLKVPSLYIAADEPAPRCDIPKLRAMVPDMLYGQTVGSGHFCQLEVPDQVNAMIDRFLVLKGLAG